jgi:hypothetical protein
MDLEAMEEMFFVNTMTAEEEESKDAKRTAQEEWQDATRLERGWLMESNKAGNALRMRKLDSTDRREAIEKKSGGSLKIRQGLPGSKKSRTWTLRRLRERIVRFRSDT